MPPQMLSVPMLIESMNKLGVPPEQQFGTLQKLLPVIEKQNKEAVAELGTSLRLSQAMQRALETELHMLREERLQKQSEKPPASVRRAEFATGGDDAAARKLVLDQEKKKGTFAPGRGGGAAAGGGQPEGGAPGGVGSQTLQDKDTGQKYVVNNRSGKAWKFNDETGKYESISPNAVPKTAAKMGSMGGMGARESVFTQRQMLAANEAARDLENVAKLPLSSSTGVFGGRRQGPSLMDATVEVMANKVTSQEVQLYNTMATGFQRSLATIEAAGLMPSGALTHQMDNVMLKEGDSNLTKLSKLAQTRQIVEAGLDVMLENPRVSEAEKAKAKEILKRMEKAVPFTQDDVIKLSTSTDKKLTLKDMMPKKKATADTAGGPKIGSKEDLQKAIKDGKLKKGDTFTDTDGIQHTVN